MTHSASFIEYIHHLCNGNRLASTKELIKELNGFGMASPKECDVATASSCQTGLPKDWVTLTAEIHFMVPLSQETSAAT